MENNMEEREKEREREGRTGRGREGEEGVKKEIKWCDIQVHNLLNAHSQLLSIHVFNLFITKYGLIKMHLISRLGEEKLTQEMSIKLVRLQMQFAK